MQTFKHLEHSLKQGIHVNLVYGVGSKVMGNVISSNGTIFPTRTCTLPEGKMFSHVCLWVYSCGGGGPKENKFKQVHVVGGPHAARDLGCYVVGGWTHTSITKRAVGTQLKGFLV